MLASFNYYDPPMICYLIGAALGLALLVPLAKQRSVILAVISAGISWGLIAFVVHGFGRGDMKGLVQVVSGVMFTGIGAVIGLVVSLIAKSVRRRVPDVSTSNDSPADPSRR